MFAYIFQLVTALRRKNRGRGYRCTVSGIGVTATTTAPTTNVSQPGEFACPADSIFIPPPPPFSDSGNGHPNCSISEIPDVFKIYQDNEGKCFFPIGKQWLLGKARSFSQSGLWKHPRLYLRPWTPLPWACVQSWSHWGGKASYCGQTQWVQCLDCWCMATKRRWWRVNSSRLHWTIWVGWKACHWSSNVAMKRRKSSDNKACFSWADQCIFFHDPDRSILEGHAIGQYIGVQSTFSYNDTQSSMEKLVAIIDEWFMAVW